MKVRLLTSMATSAGESYAYGSVVELPESVARRLVESGQAEALERAASELPELETHPARIEDAAVEPPETATHPANRRRRSR